MHLPKVKAPAAAFWVAEAIAMAAVARSEYADCEGIPYLLTFCFLNNITAYSIKEPIISNLKIIISIHIRTEDKYFCPELDSSKSSYHGI